jgi:catechol 2,3-dioxygenase
MDKFTLHPQTTVGTVSLTVADLATLVRYYQEVIGLRLRRQDDQRAVLGTSEADILILYGKPDAVALGNRTGLYHFAILLPDRAGLAHWLKHFFELGYRLPGMADHLVSEALYLSDPEGNGIEIYRDRPREAWPMAGSRVRMTSDPLDLNNLLAEAPATAWAGLPAGTTLGHVHLKVNDLARNEEFYLKSLGFDLMQADYPGARFVSAGGYHHHLGMNTWHSAGAAPLPAGARGLRAYTIRLPNEAERARLLQHLQGQGYPLESGAGADPAVRDPAGNRVELTVA